MRLGDTSGMSLRTGMKHPKFFRFEYCHFSIYSWPISLFIEFQPILRFFRWLIAQFEIQMIQCSNFPSGMSEIADHLLKKSHKIMIKSVHSSPFNAQKGAFKLKKSAFIVQIQVFYSVTEYRMNHGARQISSICSDNQ